MSASKKPRKKYRPKSVSKNPISDVFGGLTGDHMAHYQRLAIRTHGAMAEMVQGRGTREHWDLLIGAINMANVMCEQGIGDEFRPQTLAGRDVLCEVGKRAVKMGRFLFKGDEIGILNEALDCHDAQLQNIRAIDVERAADEVIRRVRHGINTTNVRAEIERENHAA